jgi:hypothetical protein
MSECLGYKVKNPIASNGVHNLSNKTYGLRVPELKLKVSASPKNLSSISPKGNLNSLQT